MDMVKILKIPRCQSNRDDTFYQFAQTLDSAFYQQNVNIVYAFGRSLGEILKTHVEMLQSFFFNSVTKINYYRFSHLSPENPFLHRHCLLRHLPPFRHFPEQRRCITFLWHQRPLYPAGHLHRFQPSHDPPF